MKAEGWRNSRGTFRPFVGFYPIIAATDADGKGRTYAQSLAALLAEMARPDLSFTCQEPSVGKDWNEALQRDFLLPPAQNL